MKNGLTKLLISINLLFLVFIAYQNWLIKDTNRSAELYKDSSDFWHDKYIHQKIYGDQ